MYIDKATQASVKKELVTVRGRKRGRNNFTTVDCSNAIALDQTLSERIDFTKNVFFQANISPLNYHLEGDLNKYFRLGFKFSKSGWPAMTRQAANYPLWHLTKNSEHPLVGATYYNEKGEESPPAATTVIDKYDTKAIFLYLYMAPPRSFDDEPNSIYVVVEHQQKIVYTYEFPYESHKYAWLTAWGDGHPFGFEMVTKLI